MKLDNLPGKEAQLKMAPIGRAQGLLSENEIPESSIRSSVLVLLYPPGIKGEGRDSTQEEWSVLLMKRSNYNGAHSGQISFPGGKREPYDKDNAKTAERETFEELGISADSYRVFGELTHLYIPVSGFVIYPVLAVSTNGKFPAYINEKEVQNWKVIPLSALDPKQTGTIKIERGNREWSDAPCYIIDDYAIWGATAMILSELYQFMLEATVRISLSSPYISSSNVDI